MGLYLCCSCCCIYSDFSIYHHILVICLSFYMLTHILERYIQHNKFTFTCKLICVSQRVSLCPTKCCIDCLFNRICVLEIAMSPAGYYIWCHETGVCGSCSVLFQTHTQTTIYFTISLFVDNCICAALYTNCCRPDVLLEGGVWGCG